MACHESNLYIIRLSKTSLKACFPQQALTKKKCVPRIIQDEKCTATATNIGLMDNYHKGTNDLMQFYLCIANIEGCVKGIRKK